MAGWEMGETAAAFPTTFLRWAITASRNSSAFRTPNHRNERPVAQATVPCNVLLMWIVRLGESLRSAWMVSCGNSLLAGSSEIRKRSEGRCRATKYREYR